MCCSPCLQLLRYFNQIAAAHVDFALMKLWLACPIFTWLAPCPRCSKYWQYLSRTTPGTSLPLSDLRERGRKKIIHVESTLADGRMAHPGNSGDLPRGTQTWLQVFSYESWQCPISVASVGRQQAHADVSVLIKPRFICIFQFSQQIQMERAACGIHKNHCNEIGVNSCTLLGRNIWSWFMSWLPWTASVVEHK